MPWRAGLAKESAESAPVAARGRGPQSADRCRIRDHRTHSPVPGASLHAARIVCPLHRVYDRVETRSHQVAQMPSPTIFAFHAHSDSQVVHSTLAGKSQFLVLRPVISTPYRRHLATDAEKCLFSLRTALLITCCTAATTMDRRSGLRFPALHMAYKLQRSCTHRACRKIGLEFHHALRLSRLYRPDVMIVCESGTELEKNR